MPKKLMLRTSKRRNQLCISAWFFFPHSITVNCVGERTFRKLGMGVAGEGPSA
jgi:hypothetical protein